ncbi:MAG: hypothetical protein ABR514_11210 [Chthoniobacterales bacterium]
MTRKIWIYPATFGQLLWRRSIEANSAWKMQLFGSAMMFKNQADAAQTSSFS